MKCGVLFLASLPISRFSLWSVRPAGDGGNDVSMIQESDCGVGVEGKVSAGCGGVGAAGCGGAGAGRCSASLRGTSFPLETQL